MITKFKKIDFEIYNIYSNKLNDVEQKCAVQSLVEYLSMVTYIFYSMHVPYNIISYPLEEK
jgi:hypothetical protein